MSWIFEIPENSVSGRRILSQISLTETFQLTWRRENTSTAPNHFCNFHVFPTMGAVISGSCSCIKPNYR
uniref:Uncharacterized protein n=1 Tax=Anguilla anguilla TaxID=7936 RepID=A0A0E9QNG0_ANGAN